MRQILIYFVIVFVSKALPKVFHFYLFFLDGNYRVFLTRVKYRKNPYNLNPVKGY